MSHIRLVRGKNHDLIMEKRHYGQERIKKYGCDCVVLTSTVSWESHDFISTVTTLVLHSEIVG